MSFAAALPKPKHVKSKWDLSDDEEESKQAVQKPQKKAISTNIPPYMKRSKWIPTQDSDYAGGGAYPECRIVQYPQGMGRDPNPNPQKSLALETDVNGMVKYENTLKEGMRSDQFFHTGVAALKPDSRPAELIPDEDELERISKETKKSLDDLLYQKTNRNKPTEPGSHVNGPTFVKYVPSESQQTSGAAASTRIIRLSEVPVDPLEPPRFKHRKVPRAPGSPPAPLLRSPPRKVSAEEQKNWVIPPCISNWKNAKGYTIPLDKRLANDGRGLQDVTINEKFSKFSEALFLADRHAREEVKLRQELSVQLAQKQKKEKEERLRELAQMAREKKSVPVLREDEEEVSGDDEEDDEDEEELRRRQDLRREKARERERNMKKKQQNVGERDISEKIALGQFQPTQNNETMYDQRLFNQTSGLSSGYTNSDSYNLYDKPLFNSTASSLYKVGMSMKKGENAIVGVDEESFVSNNKPFKGFAGTDATTSNPDGPVFEKTDVFGMDSFMKAAKRGRDDEDQDERKKR